MEEEEERRYAEVDNERVEARGTLSRAVRNDMVSLAFCGLYYGMIDEGSTISDTS